MKVHDRGCERQEVHTALKNISKSSDHRIKESKVGQFKLYLGEI